MTDTKSPDERIALALERIAAAQEATLALLESLTFVLSSRSTQDEGVGSRYLRVFADPMWR